MLTLCLFLGSFLCALSYRTSFGALRRDHTFLQMHSDAADSIEALKAYDLAYLRRQKAGRTNKMGTASEVEDMYWKDMLGETKAREEKASLAAHCKIISQQQGCCITLGIMAHNKDKGLNTLKMWVEALDLPKGLLLAYLKDDIQVPVEEFPRNEPVYIKYSNKRPTEDDKVIGDAYMKPYGGEIRGVIFQPSFADNEEFYQMGDFPLDMMTNTE